MLISRAAEKAFDNILQNCLMCGNPPTVPIPISAFGDQKWQQYSERVVYDVHENNRQRGTVTCK